MQPSFFRTFCDFKTFVHKVFIMSCRNLQQKMSNKIIWSFHVKTAKCILFSEEKAHARLLVIELQLGQSIQEWTKRNLWKTAFKKFEMIWFA